MNKIEQILKTNQVAIILQRSGKSSIDFQLHISDKASHNEEHEQDVETLVALAAGMIAYMNDKPTELFKAGKRVLAAAKEINDADNRPNDSSNR